MAFDWSSIDLVALEKLALSWGGRILSALVVLLIGMWLARKFAKAFAKVLENRKIDVTLTKFLSTILYYIILVAVIIAAAAQVGINTASFLTVVGAASLAVGLALKDSLGNFASGVMLILFRPFRVGDYVTVGGESGTVEEIHIFNTILNTPDNQKKIIPNSLVSSNTITNVTANSTRRIDLLVGIGYDDDIKKAKETLESILAETSGVLPEPEPVVAVADLGESSVDLVVRPWVRTDEYWRVRFEITEKIKQRFDEQNISIPYPQRDVHMHGVAEA